MTKEISKEEWEKKNQVIFLTYKEMFVVYEMIINIQAGIKKDLDANPEVAETIEKVKVKLRAKVLPVIPSSEEE